ncbi:hypothetical protein JTE90_009012 [Oedothorax gibbosus]|uniref:Uncharacterized protein n=1 Tax=Oedothorax gibbosus TaxID=931172 RepID=A0AAV6VMJ6_9ARAC|nr:hypothetical protein JTE90_009012 [Oedothorax gibbosus]
MTFLQKFKTMALSKFRSPDSGTPFPTKLNSPPKRSDTPNGSLRRKQADDKQENPQFSNFKLATEIKVSGT